MIELREKIEEAWWRIVTDTKLGIKLMPSPKEHKNLIGSKKQYLDAVIKEVEMYLEKGGDKDGRSKD